MVILLQLRNSEKFIVDVILQQQMSLYKMLLATSLKASADHSR